MSGPYICARCREDAGSCMCAHPRFQLRPWNQWRGTWWLVVLTIAAVKIWFFP